MLLYSPVEFSNGTHSSKDFNAVNPVITMFADLFVTLLESRSFCVMIVKCKSNVAYNFKFIFIM